jgi:hypothetical protein
MDLSEQLNAQAPVRYRSTKAEIIKYYQEEYPSRGKDGWRKHLVGDLASFTGMKPKNLERRFDPSRRGNPEKRNTKQYEEFGKTLPPMPREWPPNGINVHFRGRIKISRKWYPSVGLKKFDVHFDHTGGYYLGQQGTSSEEAEVFLRTGSEYAVILTYFLGDDIFEDWEGEFTIL